MKRTALIFAIAFSLLSSITTGCDHSSDTTKSKQNKDSILYQCPMDCESGKTYDKAGHCPVCEMDLEPKVEI